MTYQVGQFTVKTAQEIHDDYLRTVRNGLIQQGIPNPQLGPGSDEDNYAFALANELTPIYANTVIEGDAQMPDTAAGAPPTGQTVGADLQRVMAIYGLSPRGPVPSVGPFALDCSATTIIPSGAQLIDAAGQAYQVLTGGTFAAGSTITVEALSGGASTNHSAGDVLVWVSAPPYCNSKQICGTLGQTVGTPALEGGADAEDNETARARLYDRLRNPPGSGNASQTAAFAEESTELVQKGFCYPALGGPSTSHVAVVGYASAEDQNRDVNATVMSTTVAPYVIGTMPENTEVVVTTVTNEPVDVSIGLVLPSAPTASPPGPGGGWVDGSPWPSISGVQDYANVTAITSSTEFTVNAPTPPTPNVSHVCMVDTVTWQLLRALVLAVTGSAGAYVITISAPFPNVVAASGGDLGTLIFPDATNMATYVSAFIGAMNLMGPGEKTSNVTVLGRAFRHPPPQLSWPYSMNAQQLKTVEDTGAEVLETDYYFVTATTPTVPISIALPPNQFVPRRLGFYPF